MHWLGYSIGVTLCLCVVVNANIDQTIDLFTNVKKAFASSDKNGEIHEQALNDWRSLLFPDGHNPLDQIAIDSESVSEEEENEDEEEEGTTNNVFQTKFPINVGLNNRYQRVNRETAEFFANELAETVENEWQGRGMGSFDFRVLQLNISMYNMKIMKIDFPTIRFERPASNILHLTASGGFAQIKGSYKAIYRTTRRGQIEAIVRGLNVDLTIKFRRSQSRILYLLEMDCKPNIAQFEVKLEPHLLDEVQSSIQSKLLFTLQQEICLRAKDYVRQTDEKFQSLGVETPFDSKADTN